MSTLPAPWYTGADAEFDHPSEWARAIIAAPDDAGLRQIYADWLDEHGYHQRAAHQRDIARNILAFAD